MDFNRNPLAVPEDADFGLERLDPDVRAYLENSGALLEKPTDRLRKMNPLSIELYKRYKYDITKDPLEFGINNQHMNGGLAVNGWVRHQPRRLLRYRRGGRVLRGDASRRRSLERRSGLRDPVLSSLT